MIFRARLTGTLNTGALIARKGGEIKNSGVYR